jgi:uncharacterized protein YqfA (UPF0365 family)
MTFLDVMNLWESPVALANDLEVKLSRVYKWRVRRSIPSDCWPQLLKAAQHRGIDLTAETLLQATCTRSVARGEARMVA